MKTCRACGKSYDDSWQQCLTCNKPLEEISKPEDHINKRFQALEERIERMERIFNLVSEKKEKLAPSYQTKIQPSQPVPPAKPEKKQDIESTIGLVWLNRIGVVALLFGVAFFLKYAFDNHWIGELGRVVLGLVSGLALLVGSEVARKKKYETMSQGLHGAGVGVLYLSIYASFAFYHLIPSVAAFGLLTLVTFYCGFWSTRTDWKSSAILGMAGGFLTPFLIGVKAVEAPLLLTYLVLLNSGVLYISFYKGWRVLNVVALVLTHCIFISLPDRFVPAMWVQMLGFSTLFFILFSIFPITRNLVRREKSDGTDVLLVLLNGLIYFGHLFNLVEPYVKSVPGLVPLGLSLLYILYSYSTLKRSKEDEGLILSYVGLAILFVTIAIPIQLKQNWITIGWSLEAVIITWIGFRIQNASARHIALAIGMISLLRMFFIDYAYNPFSDSQYLLIWNERTLTYLVFVVCTLLMSWMYKKYQGSLTVEEKALPTLLVLIANGVFLVQLCLEVHSYFDHVADIQAMAAAPLFSARELTISILWILYALADIGIGIYCKFRAIRIAALLIFGAAILKIFLFDLSQLDRIYRIVSFIGLGVVLMLTSFFYQKYKDQIREFALND